MDNYLFKTLPLQKGESTTSKIKIKYETKKNGYSSARSLIRVPVKIALHLDNASKVTWTKKSNNEYILKFDK